MPPLRSCPGPNSWTCECAVTWQGDLWLQTEMFAHQLTMRWEEYPVMPKLATVIQASLKVEEGDGLSVQNDVM